MSEHLVLLTSTFLLTKALTDWKDEELGEGK